MSSAATKAVISQLLTKALSAIVKLVRTKLLPKVTERYCKSLQKGADKIAKKADELIEKIPTVKTTKKLVATLYGLRLIQETAQHIGEALTLVAHNIEATVDFSPIDTPDEDAAKEVEELNLLAMTPSADEDTDDFGGCGPDGCEIA